MIQKDIYLFPKQLEFISRPERIGLLVSGVGYGKSYCLAVYIVMKAIQNPNSRSAMASKDYLQLSIALDKEVQLVLAQMGMEEGSDYKRIKSPRLEYVFKNGSTLIGLSAQNYDSAFRGINLNFLALDEAAFYDSEAFFTALGRVRVTPSQIRVGTTPQGFNYIHKYFIESPPENSFVLTATTYDNPVLPIEYVESLKNSYTDKLFQQECMAAFIDLTAEAAYYQFNRAVHVGKVSKEDGYPIYCALDFNVAPYCGIFLQVINNKICIFDELFIADNGDTYKAVEIIKSKAGSECSIISDSTGSNRSTVGPSNHLILTKAGYRLIPSRNPFVFDRVQHLNKMLENNRIIIDQKCEKIIRCISKTVWAKNGKLDQTKDKTLTHASDSLGYACFKLFPPGGRVYSEIDGRGSVLSDSSSNY